MQDLILSPMGWRKFSPVGVWRVLKLSISAEFKMFFKKNQVWSLQLQREPSKWEVIQYCFPESAKTDRSKRHRCWHSRFKRSQADKIMVSFIVAIQNPDNNATVNQFHTVDQETSYQQQK